MNRNIGCCFNNIFLSEYILCTFLTVDLLNETLFSRSSLSFIVTLTYCKYEKEKQFNLSICSERMILVCLNKRLKYKRISIAHFLQFHVVDIYHRLFKHSKAVARANGRMNEWSSKQVSTHSQEPFTGYTSGGYPSFPLLFFQQNTNSYTGILKARLERDLHYGRNTIFPDMACPRVSRWPLKFASARIRDIRVLLVGGVLFFHRALAKLALARNLELRILDTVVRWTSIVLFLFLLPFLLYPSSPPPLLLVCYAEKNIPQCSIGSRVDHADRANVDELPIWCKLIVHYVCRYIEEILHDIKL